MMLHEEDLTRKIIGSAIEVHRELGPGLLESAYEECMCHELHLRRMKFHRQKSAPVIYKSIKLNCDYKADLIVEEKVLLELKAVEVLLPVHEAQLLTYLNLTKIQIGFLLNFHVPVMKDGIKRIVL